MKVPCISDFSVLIGIDWADKKHDVCEISLKSKSPRYAIIDSSPKAIHEWAMSLKQRFPDKPVAVACENTGSENTGSGLSESHFKFLNYPTNSRVVLTIIAPYFLQRITP